MNTKLLRRVRIPRYKARLIERARKRRWKRYSAAKRAALQEGPFPIGGYSPFYTWREWSTIAALAILVIAAIWFGQVPALLAFAAVLAGPPFIIVALVRWSERRK